MPLTVYEKHSVKPNMKVVVYGKLTFNKLDEPRVQQPNEFVREPKPEYVVALTDVKFKGDDQLVSALKDTMYGDHNENLSLYDKSPFPPIGFGSDNQGEQSDHVVAKGKALKNGQKVLVHVVTFESYGNVGCGFDAIKLPTTLANVELQDTTGTVSADVFDI